jgi:hypothetical protein
MSAAAPPPGRRRAGGRGRRLVWPLALVAVALLLVAGVVALLLWWLSPDDEPTADERLADCRSEHEVEEQAVVESGEQVLRRCAWPPPPGVGGDGYHELELTVLEQEDGPLVAYTVTGPCERLAYRLGDAADEHEASAGQVVDGGSGGAVELTPEVLDVVPELSPRTLAVVTTDAQPVTEVRCVS